MKLLPGFALIACLSAVAAGQANEPPPPPPPPAQAEPEVLQVQGTIVSFNYNNRGMPESFIVRAQGSIGQVNFEDAIAETLSKALAVGQVIDLKLEAENGPPPPPGRGPDGRGPDGRGPDPDRPAPPAPPQPDHAVYRLISLRDASGKQFDNPIPPKLGPRQFREVEGTVTALNYDRRGAPNGIQLSTGDVVRFGPREAQMISVKSGDAIKIGGQATLMPNGHFAMQAQQVNGQSLQPEGRGGEPGDGRGPGRGERPGP